MHSPNRVEVAPSRYTPFPLPEPEAALVLAPLPVPVSSLIGRESEVKQLIDLIQHPESRLVTVTGPGGIGKTRLALEAALRLRPAISGGVGFLPLAHLRDASYLGPAIATYFNVPHGVAGPIPDQIATVLGNRATILFLDNFEQILDGATFVIHLLSICPSLTIAITSRARLNVRGEREFRLAPLAHSSLNTVVPAPAVELFVERAKEANANFAADRERLRVIGEICGDLDGVPLAIELAAARCRVLPPEAMRPLIQRQLEFLTGGPRDAPVRQQTVHDTIQWTYDLLPDRERQLFRLLCVFPAGFTLEAAVAVAQAADYFLADEDALLVMLAGTEFLADFSLLLPVSLEDPSERDPRFSFYEAIREFGFQQLSQHHELEIAMAGLCAWCERLHIHTEPSTRGAGFARFDFLEQEIPNLRAALAWLSNRGEARAGLCILQPLAWFLTQRFRLEEAIGWVDALLALPEARTDPAEYADALSSAAKFHFWYAGYNRAVELLEESLAIARVIGPETRIAQTLQDLANALFDRGDIARANALLLESAIRFDAAGHELGKAISGTLIARIALEVGDLTDALGRYRAAHLTFQSLGQQTWVGLAHESIGNVLLELGDISSADREFRSALALAHELSDHWRIACCFSYLGEISRRGGDPERAAVLFATGERQRTEMGISMRPSTERKLDRWKAQLRAQLGEERFAHAWSIGKAFSRDEAFTIARANGPLVIAPPAAPHGSESPPTATGVHHLTAREIDVLRLICEGKSNREIGDALHISHRTVMQHVANILGKINVSSRTAAVAWAHRHDFA